eukprot:460068_1
MMNIPPQTDTIPAIPPLPNIQADINGMILIRKKDKEALITKAYKKGHTEGYKVGYSEGYDNGYEKGYDKGYMKGNKASTSVLNVNQNANNKVVHNKDEQIILDAAQNISESMKQHIQQDIKMKDITNNSNNIDKTSLKYAGVSASDMESILIGSFTEESTNCDKWKAHVKTEVRKRIRNSKPLRIKLHTCLEKNNIYYTKNGNYFNVNKIFYSDYDKGILENLDEIKVMYSMNKEMEEIYKKIQPKVNEINRNEWVKKQEEKERKKKKERQRKRNIKKIRKEHI